MSLFKSAPQPVKLTPNQCSNIQSRVRNELLSSPTSAEAKRYRQIAADAISGTDFTADDDDTSGVYGY